MSVLGLGQTPESDILPTEILELSWVFPDLQGTVVLIVFIQNISWQKGNPCMWKPQQPPLHSVSTHSLLGKHIDTYWGLHCISKKSSKQSCVIWKFTGLSCFKQRWLMKVRSQFLERLSLFTTKGKDKNFHEGAQKGNKCSGDITTHRNLPQKSWRLTQACTATKCNRTTFSWGKSIFADGWPHWAAKSVTTPRARNIAHGVYTWPF